MGELLRFSGRSFLDILEYLGRLTAFCRQILDAIIHGRFFPRLLFRQIVTIGYGSQTVVVVTGAFTGAVFAAQSYFKFKDFGVESSVGALVSVAMCRELAPVLTGLMVTGRVGASMAAEIGTMKVSEQIDALRAMAIHPVDYLVIPRLGAIMISMPLLIAESIAFGILAGYAVTVIGFGVPRAWYVHHLLYHTELEDIVIGMTKGFVFGLLIVIISCYQGLAATNGAVGVGRGTTISVVHSSLAILICNFFLTFFLNSLFPLGSQ